MAPEPAELAPAADSRLLEEFAHFVAEDIAPAFGMAAVLSDLECHPFGNIGTLAPVCTFLSLCGIPLPPPFVRFESSCTAFAPFLRGQLRFFIDAQHHYISTMVKSLDSRLRTAEIFYREHGVASHLIDTPEVRRLTQGVKHLALLPSSGEAHAGNVNPVRVLHWHGRDISKVSTLDEWVRFTSGVDTPVYPGADVYRITPSSGDGLPFFALQVVDIESGPHKGRSICRTCVRPVRVPALVHFDLTPDHPLSQWLAGYENIPDQLVDPATAEITADQAGDWGSLLHSTPWRQAVIAHLQSLIQTSYSLTLP